MWVQQSWRCNGTAGLEASLEAHVKSQGLGFTYPYSPVRGSGATGGDKSSKVQVLGYSAANRTPPRPFPLP